MSALAPIRSRASAWRAGLSAHPLLALLLAFDFAWTSVIALDVLGPAGAGAVIALAIALLAVPVRALLLGSPLAFLVLALALAGGEVYLRLRPEDVGGGGGGNPALAQIYRGLYSYNARGLRGPDFADAPPPGSFRILAVGDSFTFGQGVGEADTYPAALERILDARGDTDYEVVNAGRAGRNQAGALQYLQQEGFALRPHAVILQFYLNDIEERAGEQHAGASDSASEGAIARAAHWLRTPLRRSYALFFLRSRLRGQTVSLDGYIDAVATDVAGGAKRWRDCASALAESARLAVERGIPVVVALFPHPGPPRAAVASIHAAVAGHCAAIGARVVDLAAVVAAVPPQEQVLNAFDQHGSPAYNLAAARGIADALERAGLLRAE